MIEETNEDDVLEPAVDGEPNYFLDPEDLFVAKGIAPEDLEPENDEEEELPEFDPRHRKAFEGLLYLGRASKSFKWLGHEFLIKTMNIDEILEIGQLHQPYSGTVADIKAWQALTIAACVVSVDGNPISLPVSDDQTGIEAKFRYISAHWYPWILDKIYEQYLILDAQVAEVIAEMGKA